jgi:hypothetical protein
VTTFSVSEGCFDTCVLVFNAVRDDSSATEHSSFGRSQWKSFSFVLSQEHDSSVGDMDSAIAG